jgi:hypothetical protein
MSLDPVELFDLFATDEEKSFWIAYHTLMTLFLVAVFILTGGNLICLGSVL